MVPSNEEGAGSSTDQSASTSRSKGKSSISSKNILNVEKDSEEYKKLRERNNEAVKKSRTRTKLKTQTTLDKVEKLRSENCKLEDRIDGLKKELDLLKELFVSHAGEELVHNFNYISLVEFSFEFLLTGTKSLKRLTEVDMDVLLAEADPKNGRKKKNAQPYVGRDRDQIEKEVIELLGQKAIDESESEDDDEPQASTSRQGLQHQMDDASSEPSMMDENITQVQPTTTGLIEQDPLASSNGEGTSIETYTLIDGGAGGPAIWTTDNGEAVVVTIEEDSQGGLVATGVQQDLHDIIQGEMLMLE